MNLHIEQCIVYNTRLSDFENDVHESGSGLVKIL